MGHHERARGQRLPHRRRQRTRALLPKLPRRRTLFSMSNAALGEAVVANDHSWCCRWSRKPASGKLHIAGLRPMRVARPTKDLPILYYPALMLPLLSGHNNKEDRHAGRPPQGVLLYNVLHISLISLLTSTILTSLPHLRSLKCTEV